MDQAHTGKPTNTGHPFQADDVMAIQSRRVVGCVAELRTECGTKLHVHRFAPVGAGDCVAQKAGLTYVYVKHENCWIPVSPGWQYQEIIEIGQKKIEVCVKDIEEPFEYKEYQRLKSFHYRGGGGVGRSVPLIATMRSAGEIDVIGFVEISSSMIANLARKKFLDAPFSDKNRNVAWWKWDHPSAKKYSSVISRISRCVVDPELRGLGIAKILVSASVEYARCRWHYGGRTPQFIEITADMLNYYPFVSSSQFLFIGNTEGNLHRVRKDINYLVSKASGARGRKGMPQGGGGIMTLQRSYAMKVIEATQSGKMSLDEVLRHLLSDVDALADDVWVALHKIIRRPKPTFVRPLTAAAEQFCNKRKANVENVSVSMPGKSGIYKQEGTKIEGNISIEGLTIIARSMMRQDRMARRVQESFGFVGIDFESTIIQGFDLEISPGELVVVSGASGSGKSILLDGIWRALGSGKSAKANQGLDVTFKEASRNLRVGVLREIDENATALEILQCDLERAIRILAEVGLAEPQLFVRPVRSLSSGQRYRVRMADVIAREYDIVLIDDFCEGLDWFTAAAICKSLPKLCRLSGKTVIAASAAYDRLIPLLPKQRRLHLSVGHEPRWIVGTAPAREGHKIEAHESINSEPISDL